ncbi:MAG: isocitrate dehydrogenase [Crocinitomicaceae bacterium]|nr:isocitrate dehydrogenase [Crocinitomicaceae bacterium]|tara:strand:- start:912 stop:2363 length:1452 start_codon:yes stop_codon:yes gene_type:complete
MSEKRKITVAYGDGIGPEIMDATLRILDAAEAPLEYDEIKVGEQVYKSGISSGIEDSAWDSLRENKIFLKAPITTPQGGGYKSLNVTIRKTLGLYANVRPCRAYTPFVKSNFPKMNLTIVRENEEDLYAGIEHQQTEEVVQTLKLVSRPGIESIVRYAFEYARLNNRKKVTCMTKDNIMKQSDGLFHRVFNRVSEEYPNIEADHMIIDIGSAKLADNPESFDVVVTLNLYGDIISDIAAEVAGSVGLGGSSNVGQTVAMFEAIHGSAPDIAGKNIANPSGLLNGAIMMLVHLGETKLAEKIENAWLKTIEDGIHTGDVYEEGTSTALVGTKEFADAVIERLGQTPSTFKPVYYKEDADPIDTKHIPTTHYRTKTLVGVDVFIDWREHDRDANVIGQTLENAQGEALKLKMITNRGVKVYPSGFPETFKTDHWRCRYTAPAGSCSNKDVYDLLKRIDDAGLDFIKTEHLYEFDGVRGYSLGQGE